MTLQRRHQSSLEPVRPSKPQQSGLANPFHQPVYQGLQTNIPSLILQLTINAISKYTVNFPNGYWKGTRKIKEELRFLPVVGDWVPTPTLIR